MGFFNDKLTVVVVLYVALAYAISYPPNLPPSTKRNVDTRPILACSSPAVHIHNVFKFELPTTAEASTIKNSNVMLEVAYITLNDLQNGQALRIFGMNSDRTQELSNLVGSQFLGQVIFDEQNIGQIQEIDVSGYVAPLLAQGVQPQIITLVESCTMQWMEFTDALAGDYTQLVMRLTVEEQAPAPPPAAAPVAAPASSALPENSYGFVPRGGNNDNLARVRSAMAMMANGTNSSTSATSSTSTSGGSFTTTTTTGAGLTSTTGGDTGGNLVNGGGGGSSFPTWGIGVICGVLGGIAILGAVACILLKTGKKKGGDFY